MLPTICLYPSKYHLKPAHKCDNPRAAHTGRQIKKFLEAHKGIDLICAQELGFENDVFGIRLYPQNNDKVLLHGKPVLHIGRGLSLHNHENEVTIQETCISIPDETFSIKRFNKVTASWQANLMNGYGYPLYTVYGINAYNMQHIMDHTKGVFPERHLKRHEVSKLKMRMGSRIKE